MLIAALVLAAGMVCCAWLLTRRPFRVEHTVNITHRGLPDRVELSHLGITTALSAAIALYFEENRNNLPPVPPVVEPMQSPAEEEDAAIRAAIAVGVEELRALYAERGMTRSQDELEAEAEALLRIS